MGLVRPLVVFLGVVLAGAGCSGSHTSPAIDADNACPVPPGRSYVERVQLAGAGVGFDLNGDGTIDNAFGNLPTALRDQINKDIQSSFDTGSQFFVLNLPNWGDPPTADAPDVQAIRWMIEELRVSLFAQTLGTPAPVSEKRILTALERLLARGTIQCALTNG